jgi:hypothetical protein
VTHWRARSSSSSRSLCCRNGFRYEGNPLLRSCSPLCHAGTLPLPCPRLLLPLSIDVCNWEFACQRILHSAAQLPGATHADQLYYLQRSKSAQYDYMGV